MAAIPDDALPRFLDEFLDLIAYCRIAQESTAKIKELTDDTICDGIFIMFPKDPVWIDDGERNRIFSVQLGENGPTVDIKIKGENP